MRRSPTPRTRTLGTFCTTVLACALLCTATVSAQEAIVPIEEGERAPFSGMLWPIDRSVSVVQRVELLETRLQLDVSTCEETGRLRLQLAAETLRIETERFSSDRESLRVALREMEQRAQRQWYEAPELWFAVGVVVTAVLVVSIAAALN